MCGPWLYPVEEADIVRPKDSDEFVHDQRVVDEMLFLCSSRLKVWGMSCMIVRNNPKQD